MQHRNVSPLKLVEVSKHSTQNKQNGSNCKIPYHIECVSEKGWLCAVRGTQYTARGMRYAKIINSRWWCNLYSWLCSTMGYAIRATQYGVRGNNKFKVHNTRRKYIQDGRVS